jgi:hypothetical protein
VNVTDQRYPLSWPAGWKRTPYHQRRAAAFSKRVQSAQSQWKRSERLDVGDGLDRLLGELKRLGASNAIISSNLRLRNDGLPYAQQAKTLDDPGVAVYFKLAGKPRVLACDRWNSAADNMAAIAGHIEAIRACDRYGVGSMEQAFAGYTALPPDASTDWWLVLGVTASATRDQIDEAYRRLAREAHPDAGGSHDAMSRLNAARDAAKKAVA